MNLGGSGSGKTNSLFYLINHQTAVDKVYLYAKDPYEAKYQFSIKKRERKDLKDFSDSKAFFEHPIWAIFIKIVKNTTQIKKLKY